MNQKPDAVAAFASLLEAIELAGGTLPPKSLLRMSVQELLTDVIGPNGIEFVFVPPANTAPSPPMSGGY